MPSFPFFRERPQKHEWIGGCYTFPVEIQEGKEVFRPDCVIWLETLDLTLVGSTIIGPREPATFAESLNEPMQLPMEVYVICGFVPCPRIESPA